MKLPVRKNTRIPGYDYSTRNYYFVTICTDNKECIFGEPTQLNIFGKIAETCILNIEQHYANVKIDKYVVMPNHVHMIVVLGIEEYSDKISSLTQIIGQYKMAVSKEIHKIRSDCKVWQRSFHDHIIRNQQAYEKIWLYIEGNPGKWEEDCFHVSVYGRGSAPPLQ